MLRGTSVNESIKELIREGYTFSLNNENIRYKYMLRDKPELTDADKITSALGTIKQNKHRAIAYLKSLLTIKATLAAVLPIGKILLVIDVYNYRKEAKQKIVEVFESMDLLNDYMEAELFCRESYEVIHSIVESGMFYLKVSDRKKYAELAKDFRAEFTELTPEEAAGCPW